ncbi:MAG: diacylglycerol/lipid kinase family protein [Christensenellales bacterium]
MYIFLINPVSGKGNGMKFFQRAESAMKQRNIPYEAQISQYPKHVIELAKSTPEDCCIVCVGGDGTVREVAQTIVGSNRTLGIIPAGTGNDFALALGIAKEPEQALEQILRGNEKKVDLFYLNGHSFINVAGVGFDADVLRLSFKMRKVFSGFWSYYMAIFATILTFRFQKLKMVLPDRTIERDILLVAIGNGRFFGGGMLVCPKADPSDGLADVCIIRKIPRLKILFVLPKFLKGTHVSLPFVEYFQCKEFTLSSKIAKNFNMDGELTPYEDSAFSIQPGSLRVLVP